MMRSQILRWINFAILSDDVYRRQCDRAELLMLGARQLLEFLQHLILIKTV